MLAVASLGISMAQAAITWNNAGGDLEFTNATNWVGGVAPSDSDDIIISNGDAVNYSPGGDFGQNYTGTMTISNGSSINQSAGNWSRMSGNYSLDSGHILGMGSNNLFGDGGNTTLSLANGSTIVGGGAEFQWMNNGGGANGVQVALDGTSSITYTGGGGASWFLFTNAAGGLGTTNHVLNFTAAGGSISVGAAGIEYNNDNIKLSYEDLWNDGVIQINGSSSGTFSDYFAVTGSNGSDGYTLTAIAVPEPSSAALLGLGGLALILRRRK